MHVQAIQITSVCTCQCERCWIIGLNSGEREYTLNFLWKKLQHSTIVKIFVNFCGNNLLNCYNFSMCGYKIDKQTWLQDEKTLK